MKRISFSSASVLYGLAIVSVLAAYVFGLLGEESNHQEKLLKAFPEMSIISSSGNDPVCNIANFPDGRYFVLLHKTMAWGGPALVATRVDTLGSVVELAVVEHQETPAFFAQLEKDEYFEQFKGKYIGDSFSLDEDVNAVSGATISSQGFNRAVRESCHYLANAEFQMNIPEKKVHLSFSDPAYLILLLFALAYFGCRFGLSRYRIGVQLAATVILGFMLNFPLSMAHISSLFMGFFPSMESNIIWYILLGSIVAMILIVGKNFYCTWICPFGAIQDLLNKVSGISLPIPLWLKRHSRWSAGIIAWLSVCVIFISRNPALGSFEPFAALFSFKGFGIIWFVLPVLIFSSFFIKRMWCRFFCPVGFFLSGACKLRCSAICQTKSKNEKREAKIFGRHHDRCA